MGKKESSLRPIYISHEAFTEIREKIFDHLHENLPEDVRDSIDEYEIIKGEIWVNAEVKVIVNTKLKPRVINDTRLRS